MQIAYKLIYKQYCLAGLCQKSPLFTCPLSSVGYA